MTSFWENWWSLIWTFLKLEIHWTDMIQNKIHPTSVSVCSWCQIWPKSIQYFRRRNIRTDTIALLCFHFMHLVQRTLKNYSYLSNQWKDCDNLHSYNFNYVFICGFIISLFNDSVSTDEVITYHRNEIIKWP